MLNILVIFTNLYCNNIIYNMSNNTSNIKTNNIKINNIKTNNIKTNNIKTNIITPIENNRSIGSNGEKSETRSSSESNDIVRREFLNPKYNWQHSGDLQLNNVKLVGELDLEYIKISGIRPNNGSTLRVQSDGKIVYDNTNVISNVPNLFFDIPNAPYDGSGVLNISESNTRSIILNWTNPSQEQAALPFGSYLSYPIGDINEGIVQNDKLPFYRKLHIEYKQFINEIPTGDWIEISINNTTPYQTVIPNTITEAYFTSQVQSYAIVDLCSNTGVAPFNRLFTDQLKLGVGYQFRIYLDNSGTNTPVSDPVYGGDVSWNYLYIPDASGEFISLGDFGMADAPTNLSFTNFDYNKFDIVLNTTGYADDELNTTFPIPSVEDLTYRFAITLSGEIDPNSIQMSNQQYQGTFNLDICSNFQKQSSVTFNYDSIGTGTSLSLNDLDISAVPYFNYTLKNYFGVNSAYDNSYAYANNVTSDILLPIPTRTQSITNSLYCYPLSSDTASLNFPNPNNISLSDAYPNNNDSIINNIWFLENDTNSSTSFNPYLKMANNPGPGGANTGGLVGQESIGKNLSYFKAKVTNNNNTYTHEEDTSSVPTIGYLQNTSSNLDSSRFKITNQASEVGKTPDFQNKGFYTGIDITELEINNITLSNYPDICNYSYSNYTYEFTQFYNVSNTENYTESSSRIFNFNIGKKPDEDIVYTSNGYNNSQATLDNYFFGLIRPNPSSNIAINFSFNLSKLNPDWRTSLTLSSNSLVYDDPQIGANISSNTTSWNQNGVTETDIIPISDIPISYLTSSNKYNRTNTESLPQFIVKSTYTNNVLRTPQTNDISQQIAFGTNSKPLWWDFTYETNPSGQTAQNLPSNFFSSNIQNTSFTFKELLINTAPNPNLPNYNHTVEPNNNQLIWANNAFRGPSTNSVNNPYYNFSDNFYNPTGELNDYSSKFNSGYSVSKNNISNNAFWANNITTSITVNPVKFFTFEVQVPNTSNIAYQNYSLTIKNASGAEIQPYDPTGVLGNIDGFILYQNEYTSNGSTYPSSDKNRSYNGLLVWTNTTNSQGTFDGDKDTNGVPSTIRWRIVLSSTSLDTTLQLSIGIPDDNSIGSVEIDFF